MTQLYGKGMARDWTRDSREIPSFPCIVFNFAVDGSFPVNQFPPRLKLDTNQISGNKKLIGNMTFPACSNFGQFSESPILHSPPIPRKVCRPPPKAICPLPGWDVKRRPASHMGYRWHNMYVCCGAVLKTAEARMYAQG